MEKFLIVGLGNPGNEYINTRHNVGYDFLTFVSKSLNLSFNDNIFNGNFFKTILNEKEVYFAQPQTYMNLSGNFVKKVIDFYKIDLNNVLIVYDDISLPIFSFKLKKQGSSGGQNGIKDIILKCNTENIKRLKIGIGSKKLNQNLADFVLSKFSKNEVVERDKLYSYLKAVIIDFLQLDFEKLMSKYNK